MLHKLGRVARVNVGLDLFPIGLELLPGLLLLAVVVVEGLTILGDVAQVLLNLLGILLIRGTRRSRRRRTGCVPGRRRLSTAGLLTGVLAVVAVMEIFTQLPFIMP